MAEEGQASLDRPLPILSWAMYDFANTIYSAIVVTAFFPKFMGRLAGRDIYTGLAQTVSMVLAGLVVPALGALADRTGRARTYLWWITIGCCAATAGIGLVGDDAGYGPGRGTAPAWMLLGTLALFGLANLTYQASLVFYDMLLPAVASPRRQGFVSGLGVGLGYLGVAASLPIALSIEARTGAARWTFLVAAVGFLLCALPLFAWVRAPRPQAAVRVTLPVLIERFRGLGATLRTLWHARPVFWFFVGNFLCVDVVNTLIMWTRRFLEEEAKFSDAASGYTLLGMSLTAFVLGLGLGWLTDRIGPKRAFLASAGALLVCIVVGSATRRPAVLLPVVLFFGSGGLAGVWVAGRKFVLDVAPPERVGEFFGLYGVTQKLSVLGCTLFAAVADWAGYRLALLSLLAPLIVGIGFLMASRAQRIAEESRE
ncbi:MAG: MFS transporter [Planctomycetes bacterium]|nr:MFS transporter [Planctomycetota bacterium]